MRVIDRPARLLVVGSRGFVGSNILRAARDRGWSVAGVSRAENVLRESEPPHYRADIARDDLLRIIRGFSPSVVVHTAGSASVPDSFVHPLADFRESVETWANLLDGVRRSETNPVVVFTSSAAVYGTATRLPITEAQRRRPLSPYGFHKLMCENLAESYSAAFGTRVLICRLFSLIGPGQKRLLPWELFRQFLDDSVEEVVLVGSADSTRDYLHIDDAISGILDLATLPGLGGDKPAYVNIASGTETSVREVAEVIGRDLPAKPLRFRGIERPGDPKRWCADTSLISTLLPHWAPRSFDQAAKDCISYWLHL